MPEEAECHRDEMVEGAVSLVAGVALVVVVVETGGLILVPLLAL